MPYIVIGIQIVQVKQNRDCVSCYLGITISVSMYGMPRHKRCVSCLTIHIPNIHTEYQVVIITYSRSLSCVITN